MSDPAPRQPSTQRREGRARRGAIVGIVTFVAVALVVWFSISVLPRWWSQRVGDQVQGDLSTGALLGFMYGFLATILPLAVLAIVARFFRRSVKGWVIGVAIALVLAAPNLVTLGIALGRGDAAHAADRTLDVEAPYFRGGMIVGVAVALMLATVFFWTSASRRRARRRADEAERKLAQQRSSEHQAPPADRPGSSGS